MKKDNKIHKTPEKLKEIEKMVEEVKNVTRRNIDEVLKSGEKLDSMIDRVENYHL